MAVEIAPTEKRDVHVKTYVEPSVAKAISEHQHCQGFYSISEAVRDLILSALDHEYR